MMDRALIERLAREAGLKFRTPGDDEEMHQEGMDGVHVDALGRLVALVAEECAKEADEQMQFWRHAGKAWPVGGAEWMRCDARAGTGKIVALHIRDKFRLTKGGG